MHPLPWPAWRSTPTTRTVSSTGSGGPPTTSIATAFGDTETAHDAAGRVRKLHSRVKGIDPITGDPYAAGDPENLLWVHTVEWHSFLAAYRAFAIDTLSPEDEDRYIAEGAPIAALLGCPEEIVPKSVAEMRTYFESVRPRLCVSSYAREAMDSVLNPPLTDPQLLALQAPIRGSEPRGPRHHPAPPPQNRRRGSARCSRTPP